MRETHYRAVASNVALAWKSSGDILTAIEAADSGLRNLNSIEHISRTRAGNDSCRVKSIVMK